MAGYGMGTLEDSSKSYRAPQPESEEVFRAWCNQSCPGLAEVGLLLIIHARSDTESSFKDAEAIQQRVALLRGNAYIVEVPAADAEADAGDRPGASGHRYFHHALHGDASVGLLYDR